MTSCSSIDQPENSLLRTYVRGEAVVVEGQSGLAEGARVTAPMADVAKVSAP